MIKKFRTAGNGKTAFAGLAIRLSSMLILLTLTASLTYSQDSARREVRAFRIDTNVCFTPGDFRVVAKDLIDGYTCELELEEAAGRELVWENTVALLHDSLQTVKEERRAEAQRADEAEESRDRWQGKARKRGVIMILEGILLGVIIFA